MYVVNPVRSRSDKVLIFIILCLLYLPSIRHDVRVIDLVSNEYREVVSGARSAIAVDYVFQTGTVVWADSILGQISRAKMSNNISTVIIGRKDLYPDNNIDGIAVDWIHSKIYWTDTGKCRLFYDRLL